MHRNPPVVSAGGSILTLCALVNAILLEQAYTGQPGPYRFVPFTLLLLVFVFVACRTRFGGDAAQAPAPIKSTFL